MKENMKLHEVFKKAAELLESQILKTCCYAIGYAQGVHWETETEAKALFEEYFMPSGVRGSDCWMGGSDPDAKEHRIWAMLFMAEITKRMK